MQRYITFYYPLPTTSLNPSLKPLLEVHLPPPPPPPHPAPPSLNPLLQVHQALQRYKAIHGDMDVDRAFVIPAASRDWPEITWNMRLGNPHPLSPPPPPPPPPYLYTLIHTYQLCDNNSCV